MITCPICKSDVEEIQISDEWVDSSSYDCPNCGKFTLTGSIHQEVENESTKVRAMLSHIIWHKQSGDGPVFVSGSMLRSARSKELPDYEEQLDLLIQYMGKHQKSPGKHLVIQFGSLRAKIGAIDIENEDYVVEAGFDEGLINGDVPNSSEYELRLTPAGQKRYRALKNGNVPTEKNESDNEKDNDLSMIINVSPADILRIWGETGEKSIRLFLSHKAQYKEHVSALKEQLARYGVCAFVAHEDIEDDEEWQPEIELALNSMDVLVALLTEDFHDSLWTDQEVGFAKGRDVPVIGVRLGCDPYGFIGKKQGVRGCSWEDIPTIAKRLYKVLHKRVSKNPRFFEGSAHAYADSTSFADSAWKVKNVLATFKTMSQDQVQDITKAFSNNSQNVNSFDGKDALLPLLAKWTGKEWQERKNTLIEKESS